MPTMHTLKPERRTLHGHFSRDLPPVLTIDPGDTVQYSTLDANWGLEPFVGGPYYHTRKTFEGRVPGLDDGHALVGPVAVRGARPGMTLEVQVKTARPLGLLPVGRLAERHQHAPRHHGPGHRPRLGAGCRDYDRAQPPGAHRRAASIHGGYGDAAG
jgi:hypothetical protein